MRLLAILGALALLTLPAGVLAKGQAHPDPPADMAKSMADWQALMVPGPQHDYLDQFVGDWDTVSRMWMGGPDAPPTETKGESSIRWALGGRYLEQRYTGSMMGMPMEGIGYTGYDRNRNRYFMTWMDNFSTAPSTGYGMFGPEGKVLSFYGQMDEPMTGEIGKGVKYVTRIVDADTHVFEVHDLALGENAKVVEVEYTRRK